MMFHLPASDVSLQLGHPTVILLPPLYRHPVAQHFPVLYLQGIFQNIPTRNLRAADVQSQRNGVQPNPYRCPGYG